LLVTLFFGKKFFKYSHFFKDDLNMKKSLSALLLSALVLAPCAYATDFFLNVEGGRSSSDLNFKYTEDGTSEPVESTLVTVGAGISFQSQIVLGVGLASSVSDNFLGAFDSYKVSQQQLYVGYRINVNKHLRITPQIGFTHWKLTTEESVWFNDEKESATRFSGDNTYGQINLEFPVGKLVTIVASISRTNYDFGSTNAAQAGVIFTFN
jgi:hypothetical protein